MSALKRAHESGEAISYKGQLSDAKKPDKEHIEIEVTISSVQTYTFDATEDSPDTKRTLYNYDLSGKLPYKTEQ